MSEPSTRLQAEAKRAKVLSVLNEIRTFFRENPDAKF